MTNINAITMDRRNFLLYGLGAGCAVGLTACGQSSSRGSYEDGYSAGYAAGVADTEAKVKQVEEKTRQEEEEQKSSITVSDIEYTINSACLGAKQMTGETILILDVTAKNVSSTDQRIFFNGSEISAYQNGKGLRHCLSVEGRDLPDSMMVQAGVTLDGWMAYELLDSTTPVECRAVTSSGGSNYYGLTNPQTFDLSTLCFVKRN